MFSVKWVIKTPFGSVTNIYEANTIAAAFRDELPPPPGCAQQLKRWQVADRPVDYALFIINPYEGLSGRSFDVGTIYVMNESGATVGKFVLSTDIVDRPEPLRIAA